MAGGLNRNIVIRLMADTSNYSAGMAKVSAESSKLSTTMETSAAKTKLLTTGVAAAGVAAVALGVAATSMAAEFDASMSTVQANTGASAAEMGALRTAAIEAGASTVYAATDAADAINELGKAGMSTADILSGGLTGALNLAASDGMEVAEAAELMSSAMAQFNLTGADASKIADALAAGAGKAQGSAHDLGYALSQAGMVANSYGISMEETTGALTAFANAGMIGSDAGTSLKTMLIALANPSTKASDTLEELGIHASDAQGNFVGLADLAGQLQTQMSGLTQEQRNQAMATIFGSDAIRAANVLYKEGKGGIEDWTEAVSDAGYAAEQAAAKNDNLKGDLENLSGSFESLMISLGEGSQGALRSLVQTLDLLVDGISGLPAPVLQGAVALTALVGGSAALHSALKPLSSSTSSFAQSLGLVIDPGQRLLTALPQLNSGFFQLATAAQAPKGSIDLLSNGMTRSQTAMSGLQSIGGSLVSLLGGPWGIALTAAAAALTVFASRAQEAKQRAESLQTALESTGDASEQIVKNLSNAKIDNSWIVPDKIEQAYFGYEKLGDLLDDVGIKMSDMALAAQGNADAMSRITSVTDEMTEKGFRQRELAGIILSQLNEEKQNYEEAAEATKKQADALDEVSAATGTATNGVDQYGDAASAAASDSSDLAEQIEDLVDSFLGLNGVMLNSDEAVTKFNQEILDTTESIAGNGRALDENGNALAGHETAAYNSQAALQSLAASAQQATQKILEEGEANYDATASTDGLKEASERVTATLQAAREAFIRNATAAGMSSEAAERLADRYGLSRTKADELALSIKGIPEKKSTDYSLNGADAGISKAKSLRDLIVGIPTHASTTYELFKRTYNIQEDVGSGVRLPGGATGGRFSDPRGEFTPGYASGGPVLSGLMRGPGTATSDSIQLLNARVADGEFVQTAAATDYYSPGFMSLLNERRIPRDMLFKQPQIIVQPPQTKQERQSAGLSAEQVEQAMASALSRLPNVAVFSDGQAAAIAFAKPFSREISKLGERGVR